MSLAAEPSSDIALDLLRGPSSGLNRSGEGNGKPAVLINHLLRKLKAARYGGWPNGVVGGQLSALERAEEKHGWGASMMEISTTSPGPITVGSATPSPSA
nr:hypothetical protein [Sphingomonas sediminicola]